jgi:hypothetical protein
MILLIHEDRGQPPVGERVPPWGAPDIQSYAQRVRRNLQAMQKYPDLRLNYEFSALELQMLLDAAPDLAPIMREMVSQGRLAFVGGDYSQPHGHLFSGELNYRQLEEGLKIFRELAGYEVTNNFHQETCLHDQMPQLLLAFGFRTTLPPAFAHTITPIEGSPSIVGSDFQCAITHYAPLAADSVATWRGLDGSEIPLVILGVSSVGLSELAITKELHKGNYRSSDIVVVAPDMEEIHEERYHFIKAHGETVLLDQAAEHLVRRQKPTWKARLTSYWSYSEGQWAEEMTRKIRLTETALLAEEAISIAHGMPVRQDLAKDWQTVLAAMHHDVHWLEVTDLKNTYLRRMDQVIGRVREQTAKAVGTSAGEVSAQADIRVVNPLPYARKELVCFTLPAPQTVKVLSAAGKEVPTLCVPSTGATGATDVFFVGSIDALGCGGYRIAPAISSPAPVQDLTEVTVQAGQCSYMIAKDGTVRQATVKGKNLLRGPGHDLHYLDAGGNIVGGPNRAGKLEVFHGELGDVVRVWAAVGDIPAEVEFLASPHLPFLQVTTRFHFNNHSIGTMWQDWTKLNSYWPVDGKDTRHDIPYGAISGRDTVPLYAPSWLSVSGPSGRLALLNTGTPKHYVQDGVIACVWAWGGRSFSNRMHVDWAKKDQYDLTLKGTQTIRIGVLGAEPEISEVDVARAAQYLNCPLAVFAGPLSPSHGSTLAPLDFSATSLVATAVTLRDGSPAYRFYEASGNSHTSTEICRLLSRQVRILDLKGQPMDVVSPYRIGYLIPG